MSVSVKELRNQAVRENEKGELDVERWIKETTRQIWDKKLVGMIYEYYQKDAVIHAGAGKKVEGAQAIVEDTLTRQSAFPDIKIVVLDVIWSGNKEEGYRTSMPSYMVGTNTKPSIYGPPTGKKLTRENNLGVANCLVKKVDGKWQYVEEWSQYDTEAMKRVCTTDEPIKEYKDKEGQTDSSQF